MAGLVQLWNFWIDTVFETSVWISITITSVFKLHEFLQIRLQLLFVLLVLFVHLHLDPVHGLLQLLLDVVQLKQSVLQVFANFSDFYGKVRLRALPQFYGVLRQEKDIERQEEAGHDAGGDAHHLGGFGSAACHAEDLNRADQTLRVDDQSLAGSAALLHHVFHVLV